MGDTSMSVEHEVAIPELPKPNAILPKPEQPPVSVKTFAPRMGPGAPIGAQENEATGYYATGEPFTMKVWRSETGGPRLRPSTSYTIEKEVAINERNMEGPEKPRILNEYSVTLQNPLVVLGRQDFLLYYWAEEGDECAAEILSVSNTMTRGFYIKADTYIAQKAGRLGYDDVFYNSGRRAEIVVIDPELIKPTMPVSALSGRKPGNIKSTIRGILRLGR